MKVSIKRDEDGDLIVEIKEVKNYRVLIEQIGRKWQPSLLRHDKETGWYNTGSDFRPFPTKGGALVFAGVILAEQYK